jgi:NhaC family Na+:H+ antiporter
MTAFIVFICGVTVCLIKGISLCYALALGLVCFYITGLSMGYRAKELMAMIFKGGKTSFAVIKVLLIIGCITALWRASGTIEFFVYYGIKFITPHLFIITVFMLALVLSYLLGTSFGVVGTAGIVMMILARSGGVNPLITAGAVMSGAFFGERSSPSSSSTFLAVTAAQADMKKHLILMLKTSAIPLAITFAVYIFLSIKNPIGNVGTEISYALENGFDISWYAVLPAAIIVILPWFKVKAFHAMVASAAAAFLLTILFQGQTFASVIKACVFGYYEQSAALGKIVSGGGMVSMISVMIIVVLSSAYCGIFEGTKMTEPINNKLRALADRTSLFAAQTAAAVFTAGIFCNQTAGIILSAQMLGKIYKEKGASKQELATDIGCSIITIAGLIPWSIAAAVPLAMMGVQSGALYYSVFLYAVPIAYAATKKIWYKHT